MLTYFIFLFNIVYENISHFLLSSLKRLISSVFLVPTFVMGRLLKKFYFFIVFLVVPYINMVYNVFNI
mgnify:CR=1 FL=1